jgi:hypothetical protein
MAGTGFLQKQEPQIPRGINPRSLMRWGTFLRIFGSVFKRLGISTDDLDITETANGIHLKGGAGSGSSGRVPWTVSMGSSATQRIIAPGTIGGIMARIGADRLDATPPPQLTITGSAVNYIYLRIALTLSTDGNGFITGGSLADGNATVIASLEANPAVLDDPGAGLFHEHLATINASGLATQIRLNALTWSVSDTGTEESAAQISVGL